MRTPRDRTARGSSTRTTLGCLVLFALPFAGFGILGWVAAVRALQAGDGKQALIAATVGVVFCAVAIALIAGGRYGARKQKAKEAKAAEHPNEPWKWREDWSAGFVRLESSSGAAFAWCFALFWNLVSAPLLFVIPRELSNGNREALLGLLFPIIGLFLLVWAVRATLRRMRYGDSTFHLASVPAPLGGALTGSIETEKQLPETSQVKLQLTCIRKERSGKNSTRERILWQDEKALDSDALRSTGGIPVFFALPRDGTPSDPEMLGRERVFWRLEASAVAPGVDYRAQFEVPVFGTMEGHESAVADSKDPTSQWQAGAAQGPSPESRIQVTEVGPGEVHLGFPARRNTGVAAGLTAFTAVWSALIWFMIAKGAPILFPIVFGLFDLLLVLVTLDLWFSSSFLQVKGDCLQIRRRWFLFRSENSLEASAIAKVDLHIGMTSGNKAFHDVRIHPRNGKPIAAARHIRNKRDAKWVAARLRESLGLMS